MVEFEFEARGKRGADDGVLRVSIASPRPIEGYPNDFECLIRISGVVSKEARGVGAYPLQAADLAIQITKTFLAGYADDWDLYVGGEGPIPFAY